jgi:hypothetical protein
MSKTTPPEFIRLNGNAIRVTSWTPLDDPGAFRLVTIVRGSADAALLAELLSHKPLDLDVPGEAGRPVYADCLERRDTGEPPATITRFSIDLSPTPTGNDTPPATSNSTSSPAATSLEQRVAALEAEVVTLKSLLKALTNNSLD